MPILEKQVRVFISSTFRDMHAERDHLVTVVFPELRERVESLGLEFFDVDLRWGVPEKGADGETANSWEYCRQWIDRVEPFFVCMLGQRYGWAPKPGELKDKEDLALQEKAPRSITDMEVRYAVLNDRRKRRSYFYLRKELVPEPGKDAPKKVRDMYADFVDQPNWLKKLDALKDEIKSCGRPIREYPCDWADGKFTKLDEFGKMVLEDLWSGVLRDERYVSKDVWRQALGTEPDDDERFTNEWLPIPSELWKIIVALAKPAAKDPLLAERDQMAALASARLRWFQGRTAEIKQLKEFIASTDENASRLAVVAAVPGQGKSALLARLWQDLAASTINHQPSPILLAHFIGATEGSANSYSLVKRLLDELEHKESGIEWPEKETPEGQPKEEPKLDFNSLCFRLAERLGDYAGERRIVILIDALNQLTDGHDLNWLPRRLGPSVRVVVSCVDDQSGGGPRPDLRRVGIVADKLKGTGADATRLRDDAMARQAERVPPLPEQQVLDALASRQPAPLRVPLGPLTEKDVRTIVEEYFREYCKELDDEYVDAICDEKKLPQARNPLYLLVMLAELRTLGGNDINKVVPQIIASMSKEHPDTVSLFKWVLERMEKAEGFGWEAVQAWCLYLVHGRVGMASHELAELLARKLGADATATALRIERGLRRYLQRRGGQLDFFHGQLRQSVMDQYGAQSERTAVHSDIATYFRDLADSERNQSWKGASPRPFLELVFHLVGAESSDDYCKTLCDLRFVEARCRVGQVFELIADYRLAQENLPEAQAERAEERQRQERITRWTREIITYAKAWSDRRDQLARSEQMSELDPILPEPPASCHMWTEEEIEAECQRIITSPTRLDRLRSFARFIEVQCYPLLEFGKRTDFVVQHAFNCEPSGPVHNSAETFLPTLKEPQILRCWPTDAIQNLKPVLERILEGHSAVVRCVCVTPDSRRAVSGSADNTLRVWDLESGKCLYTLKGYVGCLYRSFLWPSEDGVLGHLSYREANRNLPRGVLSLSVTPDGRRAVSGNDYNIMQVWDLENGICLRTLESDYNGVFGKSAILPNRRAILSVSMTPDGRRAISGSDDHTLQVWDLKNGECLHTIQFHNETVKSVSMIADGCQAVSGSSDGRIRIWDLESGICLRVLEGHNKSVESVSVTPDGRRAVSGSVDNTLRVWDLKSGECLRILKGHRFPVCIVSMTPDGRRAVSGSADNTLRVWDLERGESLSTLEGHNESVVSVNVTPDGQRAVSGSHDKMLRVWNLENGSNLHTMESHRFVINSVSISLDGRRAVSGSAYDVMQVWDLEKGVCTCTLEGNFKAAKGLPICSAVKGSSNHSDGHIEEVSMTMDGRRAVMPGPKSTVQVWDLENGTCVKILEGHSSGVCTVSVTPDGRRVVSGSRDGTMRVWDLASGQCLCILNAQYWGFFVVSMTPDYRYAVSATDSHLLEVWDLESGQCLRKIEFPSRCNCLHDEVPIISVTPDGRRAVSGKGDRVLWVWDLVNGKCQLTLEGHNDMVYGVSVTPDGRRAVSGSKDKTLRMWDLETGKCLSVYPASAPISAVALNYTGNIVCVGTITGEVFSLDLCASRLRLRRLSDVSDSNFACAR